MNKDTRIKENEFNYAELLQMNEHAKKYDTAEDKKYFLKNISPYEQKLVLLESKNPYEVLKYLEELDLPNTKLILNELNIEEILNISELFTSEDKQNFYNNYSELELVNQFIVNDKNAEQYIAGLNTERKIELLNSSDSKTIEASSKVYESISDEEKSDVIQNITTADGSVALNNVGSYNEDISNENISVEQTSNENTSVEQISNENVEVNMNNNLEQNLNVIEDDIVQQVNEQEQLLQEDNDQKSLNKDNFKGINEEASKENILNNVKLMPSELDESNHNLELFQIEKMKNEQEFIASIVNSLEKDNLNVNTKAR